MDTEVMWIELAVYRYTFTLTGSTVSHISHYTLRMHRVWCTVLRLYRRLYPVLRCMYVCDTCEERTTTSPAQIRIELDLCLYVLCMYCNACTYVTPLPDPNRYIPSEQVIFHLNVNTVTTTFNFFSYLASRIQGWVNEIL